MPISIAGKGNPLKPIIPPITMIIGKITGSLQTERPPICALHNPTANIARK
jgi:hypothetical protein